jgi:Family of unknown function (DUF5719)
MSDIRRELYLVGGVLGLIALGLLTDAVSSPVQDPGRRPEVARHIERAAFCPQAVAEPGSEISVAVASATGGALPVDLEEATFGPTASPSPPSTVDLAERSFLTREPTDGAALNAVGYGGHVVAGVAATYEEPVEGAGAARCSERYSNIWYFPGGSSALGYDERILLYNPFADEAVARVTFFTPAGDRDSPSLDDVAVGSGSWEEISINEFAKTKDLLSATVEPIRGRVIAWRVLFAKPEEAPHGVGFTLGATETSDTWYFPEGFIGNGSNQSFTVLNPTEHEVTASLSLFTDKKVVQPPDDRIEDFQSITLEPRTSQEVSLAGLEAPDGASVSHVSALVSAAEGAEIVVERTMSLSSGDLDGVAMEMGIAQPGLRWMLPPAVAKPATDALAVYNPGGAQASVSVTLLTEDGPQSPKSLQGITLKPHLRAQIPIGAITREEGAAYAVLTSDRPVVAERLGSSDVDIADAAGRLVVDE